MKLIFATRPSALARWQTQWVINRLSQISPSIECVEHIITSKGDRDQTSPLTAMGGRGLFTLDLDREVIEGRAHAAVHSLKDLPVQNTSGLTIAAVPLRGEVRDVLVSARQYTLQTLPPGARVGTSSPRRAAQLLAVRPDLKILPLRGNVDTRLRKSREEQYEAIVLAGVGLQRLGLEASICEWLTLEIMLPAPGQGALAVVCCADDQDTITTLSPLDNDLARLTTTAERAFLSALGGGCAQPAAAYATVTGSTIKMRTAVASSDLRFVIHSEGSGNDAVELGQRLARKIINQGFNHET